MYISLQESGFNADLWYGREDSLRYAISLSCIVDSSYGVEFLDKRLDFSF